MNDSDELARLLHIGEDWEKESQEERAIRLRNEFARISKEVFGPRPSFWMRLWAWVKVGRP